MVPPPLPQQSSRAGLITAVVIFVLTTFIAGGIAFYNYSEFGKLENEHKSMKDKLAVLSGGDEGNDAYKAVYEEAKKTQEAKRGRDESKATVWRIMQGRCEELSKGISGKVEDWESALKASSDAREGIRYKLESSGAGIKVDSDSLTNALTALADEIVRKNGLLKDMESKVTKVEAEKKAMEDSHGAALAKKDEDIKAFRALHDKLTAELATYQKTKDDQITQDADAKTKQITALGDEKNQAMTQVAAKQQELAKLQKEIVALKNKLNSKRLDPKIALLRQIDGVITATSSDSTVYINLGYGDQVMPGLTFEVYDKVEGMPKDNPNVAPEDQLPQGKAAIEVIRVGTNSSECRVIRKNPGATILAGDLIANLIYDKNTKFNFMVYPGDGFDIANTGRPNLRDGEVIKGLIRRWGGAVIERSDRGVSIDTDFIILGREPQIPKNLDPAKPEDLAKIDEAKKKIDAYENIRGLALDLHIPIMNQNRFLYFIGYYDLAKR